MKLEWRTLDTFVLEVHDLRNQTIYVNERGNHERDNNTTIEVRREQGGNLPNRSTRRTEWHFSHIAGDHQGDEGTGRKVQGRTP